MSAIDERVRDRVIDFARGGHFHREDLVSTIFLRLRGFVAVLLFASTCVACSGAAPYERGKLAHPTMTTGDLASPAEEHVRAVQEGATGGSVAVGGGCGCN